MTKITTVTVDDLPALRDREGFVPVHRYIVDDLMKGEVGAIAAESGTRFRMEDGLNVADIVLAERFVLRD